MEHYNSSNSSYIITAEKAIASGVMGLCFLLGVPGNIAVIVRLAGWLKGDSFTPRLMMSLAVSDLLTLLLLPVWIWSLLYGWSFGLLLCKILSNAIYWAVYCSSLCVILLSLQRYLQVLHPQKWAKVGQKGQNVLLSGMWVLSGVLGCYTLIQRNVSLRKNNQLRCRLHYHSNLEKVATLFWETFMFVLTFFLLAFFYFHLYRGVNRTAFFNSHKMTKLETRVVVVFFIFTAPYTINNILGIAAVLLENEKLLGLSSGVDNITAALIFINSCVNPFLYAFSARTLQPPYQQTTGSENII